MIIIQLAQTDALGKRGIFRIPHLFSLIFFKPWRRKIDRIGCPFEHQIWPPLSDSQTLLTSCSLGSSHADLCATMSFVIPGRTDLTTLTWTRTWQKSKNNHCNVRPLLSRQLSQWHTYTHNSIDNGWKLFERTCLAPSFPLKVCLRE